MQKTNKKQINFKNNNFFITEKHAKLNETEQTKNINLK